MKKILGCVKRAQQEFHMIQDGDTVAVGLSGGKDSMTLLYALSLYRRFAPVSYDLKAITIDMGFEGFASEVLRDYCQSLNVPWIYHSTKIAHILFEERQEPHPCGMCARMRRGILNRLCEEHGITKLALGHHGDDLVETFFMSMIYESRLHTFYPVTHFERTNTIQIRPMIYARESDVVEAATRHHLPIVKNPCPASGETSRQRMKEWVMQLEQATGQPRQHLIEALCRSELVRKS